MTTREELILAKMAELRARKEDKEIEREARQRLRKEEAVIKQKAWAESEEGKTAMLKYQQQQALLKERAESAKIRKEEEDKMRNAVKDAFYSYYSRRRATEYRQMDPKVELTATMFKKHQQTLRDMGVTIEHLKNSNINRVRIEGDPFSCAGNNGWNTKVIDMSHLLTACGPLIDTNEYYKLNGTTGPWSGGGAFNPKWID